MFASLRHTVASLTALSAVALSSSTAWAGAWSQPSGQCYAKVWERTLVGSNAFGVGEEPGFETEPYQVFSLGHYAECGVADGWTILTNGAPIGYADHADQNTLFSGLLAVGARRGFFDGPFRVGLELEYGYQGLAGDAELAPNQTYSFRPVVASHTGRATASVGYGASNWWVTGDLGVRLFSNAELDTALVGTAQIGWKPLGALVLDLHLPYNITLAPLIANNVSGAGNTDYVGLGLGASWWFTPRFGVNLGFDAVVFAEANAATPSITAGVEWRPKLW